jgi:hypothetical protein
MERSNPMAESYIPEIIYIIALDITFTTTGNVVVPANSLH